MSAASQATTVTERFVSKFSLIHGSAVFAIGGGAPAFLGATPSRGGLASPPGRVIVCHIPLEERQRVPPVTEGRPAVVAPSGGR